MKTSTKLILLFISSIIILSGCKKLSENSYPKDSIVLSLTTINGTELLSWTKVNASDFKRYEIYASSTDNIDVINSTDKLIGTISDFEKTTFVSIDAFSDTDSILTNKTYFKVAAVLQDRKLSSNVIGKNSDIIFSGKNLFFEKVIPEKGFLYFANNNFNDQIIIDLENNSKKNVSFTQSISTSTPYFMDADLNYSLLIPTGSYDFTMYNSENLSINKTVNHTDYFYNFAMHNNHLFAIYYNPSTGGNLLGTYLLNGNSISLQYSINTPNSTSANYIFVSNDGTKLYIVLSNEVAAYNVAMDGKLTYINQQFISSNSNALTLNQNGSKFIAFNGDVYDDQLQFKKSIGFSNTGFYCFSQDGSKIVYGNNNQIEVYDATTLNKIKSIPISFKNLTINSITPFFYNNMLYCSAQGFDNNTFQQTNFIIKKSL